MEESDVGKVVVFSRGEIIRVCVSPKDTRFFCFGLMSIVCVDVKGVGDGRGVWCSWCFSLVL